jgi:hypothetical protein
MKFTGSLTANAMIRTTQGNILLVTFFIANILTFSYKGEQRISVTYVACSYWFNTGIAAYLLKAKPVSMSCDLQLSRAYIYEGVAMSSN